jgi:Domain of unknown function (DUF4145)
VYLASYRGDGGALVQAVACLPFVVFESPETSSSGWWAQAQSITRQLLEGPPVDFSLRLTTANQRLDRLVMILGPGTRDTDVDDVRRSFDLLNAAVGESVTFPADRDEHDAMTAAFPSQRWRLRTDGCAHGDATLLTDFRLFTLLEDLLQAALAHRWSLGYQINVRRESLRADDRRWLRKNLVRLQDDPSLPHALVAQQGRLAETIEGAAFLVEELVGLETEVAGARAFELVEHAFDRRFGGMGLPAPQFEAEQEGEFAELLALGYHSASSEDSSAIDRMGAAVTADALRPLLDWRPPPAWASLIANRVASGERAVDHLMRIEEGLRRVERALGERLASSRECSDLKEALALGRNAHLPSAVSKARAVLERIVQAIYATRHPGQRPPPLFDMIEDLVAVQGLFPGKIRSYLHTLRVVGNIGAHESEQTSEVDVQLVLLMLLELVSWYLLEYPGRS